MPDLRTITDVAPLVRAGALSATELVEGCLAAIDARPSVNAFIAVLVSERAREDARRADAEIQAGRYLGPLHGIPIAIKDLIDVAGTRTTSGSAVPSTEVSTDALVVRAAARGRRDPDRQDQPARVRVRHDQRGVGLRAGAEPATTNRGRPVDRAAVRRAALAAGMAFGALGTDTGGLDSHSVGGVRHGRLEAGARRDVVRRRRAAQRDARSRGPDGAVA